MIIIADALSLRNTLTMSLILLKTHVGMPNLPFFYAGDFIKVLRQKHASKSYSEMIIYVEACESGSIFEGLMPQDLNIYVTTAANAEESS